MIQGDVICWVYSTATDTRKEEFFPPEHSPLYTGRDNEAYIEANDGELFGICFGIPPDTATQNGADVVSIVLSLDKGAVAWQKVIYPEGRDINEKIDSFTCSKEGSWQRCGLAFRKMNLDEDLTLSHEEVWNEINSFGKIEVTIERGHAYKLHDPQRAFCSPKVMDQHTSSKRVIKDNGISHSVNTPVLGSCPPRSPIIREFHALPEPHGRVATFVFYYRSRMALELKKIIPDDSLPQLEPGRELRSHRAESKLVSQQGTDKARKKIKEEVQSP